MAKRFGYSPVSIFAAGCGAVATMAATANPIISVPAATAASIGAAASAIAGGIELNDEEKNIKENLDEAMDKAWNTIDQKYRLSLHTEKNTDNCLLELKREVMGENTSVDEFVRNISDKGLETSISIVIQSILKRHQLALNKDPEIIWGDEYLENAAEDMASILVDAIKSVFEDDDQLRILKAIADSTDTIVTELHQATGQVIDEIRTLKPVLVETPFSLTNIPPATNLIGREKDIHAIYDYFEQHNIVSIQADGGVGKTAIAANIINQIKKEILSGNSLYEHIAWITSTGNLHDDLAGLDIPAVRSAGTTEEKLHALCSFFENTATFFIIDNMDEPPSDDEEDLLNTISGKTKILITTRADIPVSKKFDLGDLDPEAALILFYRHYHKRNKDVSIEQIKKLDDISFAKKIVAAASYNALFIELIGKTAYADHKKLDELWEKLEEDVFSLDSQHEVNTGHGKSHPKDKGKLLTQIKNLYKTSNISDRQKEILSFVALFPPEHSIFFEVFKWAGFEDDEEDNLGALQDRGWIERDDEGYLVHTIVKGSVELQEGDFDIEKYENLIIELSNTDQYLPFFTTSFVKKIERLVVPVTVCKLLEKRNSNKEIVAELFYNIADVYEKQGHYALFAELAFDSISILLRLNQVDDVLLPSVSEMLKNSNYSSESNYEKALEYYENALKIFAKKLGEDHPHTKKTRKALERIKEVINILANYTE